MTKSPALQKKGANNMAEERRIKPMPFWEKYTLTVAEACSYFHIGERKFRELIEDYPDANYLLRNGNRIMIKRARFEQFLDTQSCI